MFTTILQDQAASLKNLEVHVGQIASALSQHPQGTLPSKTEVDPVKQREGKEHVRSITLRSGRELDEPQVKSQPEQHIVEEFVSSNEAAQKEQEPKDRAAKETKLSASSSMPSSYSLPSSPSDSAKLTMRVQDQEVKFNVFKPLKLPDDSQECFKMEIEENIRLELRNYQRRREVTRAQEDLTVNILSPFWLILLLFALLLSVVF